MVQKKKRLRDDRLNIEWLDFNNGWLMKIDNMANIQLNTVHGKTHPYMLFMVD